MTGKKIDLENVEAVDVDFEEVVETEGDTPVEVKPEEKPKLTLEEQVVSLEGKIEEVKRYQSFLSLVKMAGVGFRYELPSKDDRSVMTLNVVVKKTKTGHMDVEKYEIDGRNEDGTGIQGKWLGKERLTGTAFDMGEQQAKMYLQMFESQLELVKSEISGETVDGVKVERGLRAKTGVLDEKI
jgi:hypothetical protein